jgi:hypothetical protein
MCTCTSLCSGGGAYALSWELVAVELDREGLFMVLMSSIPTSRAAARPLGHFPTR